MVELIRDLVVTSFLMAGATVFVALVMRDDGDTFVEVTTPVFDAPHNPIVFVCRICKLHTDPFEYRFSERIPNVHPGEVCPLGHLLTLPDRIVVRDVADVSRTRQPVPVTREVVHAGSLTLGGALKLLTVAQAVMDGKEDLAALSEAVEQSPAPIKKLRPKKMTRDQWIAVAGIIVVLITGLLPAIVEHGSVDQTTIEIHLDETDSHRSDDQQSDERGSEGGTPEEEVDVPTPGPVSEAGAHSPHADADA